MSSLTWQSQPSLTTLHTGQLTAQLDPLRPQLGLHQLRVAGQAVAGNLLQVELSPHAAPSTEALIEAYVREADLIATYPQTPGRPFRPQLNWRALLGAAELPTLGAVELIASVQTSLLDSRPLLHSFSTLSAEEVWRPRDPQFQAWTALEVGSEPLTLAADDLPICLIYRLPDVEISYAEMVLSSDFASATLARDAANQVVTRHELFATALEKGVILRARRRGVFLPRANDQQAAAAWYQAFQTSPLPLTT